MRKTLVEACQLMKDSNELIQSPSSSSCICPITIFQEFATTTLGHFPVTQDEFKNKEFQAGFRNYLNLRLGFGEAEKSTEKIKENSHIIDLTQDFYDGFGIY